MKSYKDIIENISGKYLDKMTVDDKLIAEDVNNKISNKEKLSTKDSFLLRKNNEYLYETYGPKWRTKAGIYVSNIDNTTHKK